MPRTGIPRWASKAAEGIVVRLHIQPKASRSEISGEYGEGDLVRLKIRIAAPPVDGEANKELIRFLKKLTHIPAARIFILRGETSKSKDVLFQGASVSELQMLCGSEKTQLF